MHKLLFSFLLVSFLGYSDGAFAAHAFSLYDTPKYPAGFTHFAYVNPDAPKGGELYLANPDRRTSFDKFNPFSLKGVAAAGISSLMFETLATGSSDEVASMYGLLADDMTLAPDRMSMTFHLDPKARFNNGDPVTAADVKYSFDTLVEKGAPQFKSIFADVKQCVVLDGRTVRFDFKALNRFSLDIKSGEAVALVGPSGAGKSTVFQLMLRFFEAQSGAISFDGVDITRLDPVALRRNIAVVSQEPVIFSGSIADNIRYGREEASTEQVRAAALAIFRRQNPGNCDALLDLPARE